MTRAERLAQLIRAEQDAWYAETGTFLDEASLPQYLGCRPEVFFADELDRHEAEVPVVTGVDAAVGHGACLAVRRRRHFVLSVTAGLVFVGLVAAWLSPVGRVSAGVSWLIVAALLTVAVATAVGVWAIRRPCGCVGDTDPFLAQLGAAPTQTTTQVDAGRDSDH